jgi:class 3 adenylate cyclase
MEPRIQYTKTSDGVNIAYAVFGEGPPLVYPPSSDNIGLHYYSHLSASRRGVDQLTAAGLQVIRYDGRGTGSSDRNARGFTLEPALLDLEAVVERLGLKRFALLGHFSGAQAAIAYAARRPERVAQLVLRDPFASAADWHEMFPGNRVLAAMRPFAEAQWELISLNSAVIGFGFADSEIAKEYAAALRSGVTAKTWVEIAEAYEEIDVTGLLEEVSVPTLVVLDAAFPGRATSAMAEWSGPVKRIAASIPDARLVTTDDFATAVGEFVRGGAKAQDAAGPARSPGGFQTILFTDLVGHTAMMSRLGDERGRAVLREHETIIRSALRQHGGKELKTAGDGFMASFGSVTKAIECAMAFQRAFAEREGEPLSVRVGLNAGEPIEEEGDLFGATVILASRIADKAEGGEILVSDVVRQLVAGKGFLFNDRGNHPLKGFEDPVRVFEVRWRSTDN